MTKTWMLLAAAGLTVTGLTGCAAANGESAGVGTSNIAAGQCFRSQDVNNFNVRDQQILYVSTRQGYVFRLDAGPGCFAQATDSVSITPFLGADPRVCVDEQARVVVGQSRSVPENCLARVSGPIADSSVSGLTSPRQN